MGCLSPVFYVGITLVRPNQKGIWKTLHTCTQTLTHALSHRERGCIWWIFIQVLLIFLHRWQNTSCWSKVGLPFLHYFSYLDKYAQYQSLNILEWCVSHTPNINSAALSEKYKQCNTSKLFWLYHKHQYTFSWVKAAFAFCFCVQSREQTTINLRMYGTDSSG